jgi:hypothetical protein
MMAEPQLDIREASTRENTGEVFTFGPDLALYAVIVGLPAA